MASGQERALRRRIRSVQSTKKITRAMELIAASRIVKAQQRVAAARPYAEHITEVIGHLAAGGAGLDHPLLSPRDQIRRVGYIVISADRGLAGAYNSTVIRAAERNLQGQQREGREYSLTLGGSKALSYFRYRGYRIDESFTGFSEKPAYEDARTVAAPAMARYQEGEIDRLELVFTRFLSVGSQRVEVARLLPLDRQMIEDMAAAAESGGPQAAYEFEPEPGQILDKLLPRYVEARVFTAMLEAAASEQAARQRAMKAATDNAEELIGKLSISANKIRQAGITTEIMEIVGGAEALRQGKKKKADLLPDVMTSHDVLPDEMEPTGAFR